MLIKSNLSVKEKAVCKTTKDLFYSDNFHMIVEAFGRHAVAKNNELTHLVNRCFIKSGSGHDQLDNGLDVWEISRILLEIYHNQLDHYRAVFDSDDLKIGFKRFLGALYNYFMKEYGPFLIDEKVLDKAVKTNLHIKEIQNILNLVMDSYSTIIMNIERFEFVQRVNYK